MYFYDYTRVPVAVADAAFAEFLQDTARKSILDLPEVLIQHCDRWCADNDAFSEEDNRVAALLKLQTYIHETYVGELAQLMKANIGKYHERQEIMARLYERRN